MLISSRGPRRRWLDPVHMHAFSRLSWNALCLFDMRACCHQGSKDILILHLFMEPQHFEQLPNKLKAGYFVKVVSVLFTQGINEMQTLANMVDKSRSPCDGRVVILYKVCCGGEGMEKKPYCVHCNKPEGVCWRERLDKMSEFMSGSRNEKGLYRQIS
jgi:hypothetical protein